MVRPAAATIGSSRFADRFVGEFFIDLPSSGGDDLTLIFGRFLDGRHP